MDILQVRELKQSLERRDARINELETSQPQERGEAVARDADGAVREVMEQAQVFASTWATVGGRFDTGTAMEDADEAKEELRRMVQSLATLAAEAHPPADDARVAELEAQSADWERLYNNMAARCAEAEAQLAERTAAVITHNGQALACSEAVAAAFAESRERTEMMYEAFQSIRAIDNGEAYRIASKAIGVVP